MKPIHLIFGLLSLFCTALSWANAPAQDEMIGQPVPNLEEHNFVGSNSLNDEQSIGFYSNGSLLNPSQLADEGFGFSKLFRARDRAWASRELLEIVKTSAEELAKRFPQGERLQLGDLSQKRGGKISGHDSHQNGLDIDIKYLRNNHQEQDPTWMKGFDESFVAHGKVTANFDIERNWAILKELVSLGRVNRVFVDPAIKRAMCDFARERGELTAKSEPLRRMRPYDNHDDHFHLRILCPAESPRCVTQTPPPEGDGCAEAYSQK